MAKLYCPHCLERNQRSVLHVRSSRQVTAGVRELYADCDNEGCLARVVLTVAHKHDLQPPIGVNSEMALAYLQRLPKAERTSILNKLAAIQAA